eukprot:5547817-Pyramimonas_sp.AAC.1
MPLFEREPVILLVFSWVHVSQPLLCCYVRAHPRAAPPRQRRPPSGRRVRWGISRGRPLSRAPGWPRLVPRPRRPGEARL